MNTWEQFFDYFAPQYMDEDFTRNTLAEVDFIETELELQRGMHVLDVGCGTGRHSIELAKRGYRVTGIDISTGQLEQAQKAAQQNGVHVRFIKADATNFVLEERFDAAICLCEGAFGLLSMQEQPFGRDIKILKNIHACLAVGAPFLMTVLNGLRMIRMHSDDDVRAGSFDQNTLTETHNIQEYDGFDTSVLVKEKGFAPGELMLMLQIAGFKTEYVCGGTAGSWNKQILSLDEMEIMVKGRKL